MSNDFVEFRGVSLPRRMVLQGLASLLGCAFTPNALSAAAESCALTTSDIIGPFYRFGAPFQTRLAGPNEPGERLIISGKVYGSDCRSYLPNTLIEVWQANNAGRYDTDKPGNFTERVDFHLRGMMLTDQQGNYEFETIMPGRYPIPPNIPGLEKFGGGDATSSHSFPSFRIAACAAHHAALFQGRPQYRQRSLGQEQTINGD